MPYFQNITTLPALEKERRRLAKLHHPDVAGGSTEQMQEINAEYERARKRLEAPPQSRVYTYSCPRQQGRQEMPWAEYWNDMLSRIRRRQEESEVDDDDDDDDYSGD